MSRIVLQGIAYDAKSSFLKGAALAPPVIRQQYRSDAFNFYAENGTEIRPEVFDDRGDLNPSEYFDIESFSLSNLTSKKPLITLGGDHSITYPILKAVSQVHGPVHILHIDAHADLYEEFQGDPYSHACPFARIMEDSLASSLVQLGIRTMTKEQNNVANKYGVKVLPMASYSFKQVPKMEGPLYLSLDLDALDPAYAPGVSHHEPGGFTTRQVLEIIQNIRVPLIGADIVEYNPNKDINDCTAVLCAKFLREISAKMLEFT